MSALRAWALCGVLGFAVIAGPLARPAVAQTGPGPTATSSTTSVAVGPGASTTTLAPVVTTTTAPGDPSWTVSVPGPPPPSAPPAGASPADIARANQLERQIVTQSRILDILAAQYDQAVQTVAATAADLDAVRARLASARANADAAEADLVRTGQELRRVAVDAYVNLGSGSAAGRSALLGTYERGIARIDAETAIGKALQQLQNLHQVQQRLRSAEAAIVDEEQRTSDASAAATAAAARAQSAAQAATVQQQQLLGTFALVGGDLQPLVAAAHAATAQAAFNRFRASGGLDFPAPAGLAAPPVQASAAVQAAVDQVGKPYTWGAAGPDSFDCSGLVQWAWARAGVVVPRVASDQQSWTTPVPISQVAPGDLVFFGNPAHHVGVYLGGGLMVDAPHTGSAVSVVPIWWDDLSGFGRVRRA